MCDGVTCVTSSFVWRLGRTRIRLSLSSKEPFFWEWSTTAYATFGADPVPAECHWSLFSKDTMLPVPTHLLNAFHWQNGAVELNSTRDFSEAQLRTKAQMWQLPRRRFPLGWNTDQLLASHYLAGKRAGWLVHGACLFLDGMGFLFYGPSGAGKTTLSRRLGSFRPGTLGNDDRSLVEVGPDGYRLCSTPWHGENYHVANLSGRICGVFLLERSANERSAVVGLDRSQAAAALLASSVHPVWSPESLPWLVDQCAALAESVPCHTLRAAGRDDAAEEIWEMVLDRARAN